MQDTRQVSGHRLVAITSPRGKAYWLPEAYAHMPISECIRRLRREGWRKADISRHTGILYQHVRNVLEQDASKPGGSELGDDATDDPPASGVANSSISEGEAVTYSQEAETIDAVLDQARRKIARLAGVAEEVVRLELSITSRQ